MREKNLCSEEEILQKICTLNGLEYVKPEDRKKTNTIYALNDKNELMEIKKTDHGTKTRIIKNNSSSKKIYHQRRNIIIDYSLQESVGDEKAVIPKLNTSKLRSVKKNNSVKILKKRK